MAGRGVDIKLGGPDASPEEVEAVRQLGGLFVLGTERHEARRIDNQLRGRAGRQGDPGETQFFVSMDDALMRVFGGERVKSLMGTFGIPPDQPIEMKMISRTLESAQSKIEGFHFDSRKQILAYDDVLNQQRRIIYTRRSALLAGSVDEIAALETEIVTHFPAAADMIATKRAEFGEAIFTDLLRRLALQMIDVLWVEHLEVMSYTRSSVTLRAYGQRDPLIEYRKEGSRLFEEMQTAVLGRINEILPQLQPQVVAKSEAEQKEVAQAAQQAAGETTSSTRSTTSSTPVVNEHTFGRNDVVTITNGTETQSLKYKKAELLIATGNWRITSGT